MTADDIRGAVQADPQLQRLARAGNSAAIAAVLRHTGGQPQTGDVITTRGAAARYPSVDGLPGPLAFEAAMLQLEGWSANHANSAELLHHLRARAISRVLEVFPTLGLDFGDPALRATLDTLVPDVLSQAQVDAFKTLAAVAAVNVTQRQVLDAIGLVPPEASAQPPAWITHDIPIDEPPP